MTGPVVAVAAVVFDDDGRLLVIERGRPPGLGLWSVPGGKVERGEALADALVREVREETGLTIRAGALVEVIERMGDTYHFVILDYLGEVTGGELRAGDDVRAARWVTDAELAALPTTDGLLPVVARARALRFAVATPPPTR